LKSLRPATGVTPQEFVQRASIAAWGDESHVEENRARYAAKREVFLELFRSKGIEVAGSNATFYLWVKVPGTEPSEGFAMRLLDAGVVVAPGSFFGPEGEGYVRMAMVPTLEDCRTAAASLEMLEEVRA
jgi:acetylornithine aminotransferase